MPLASQNTDAMTFPSDGTDLVFGANCLCPLFWLLFGFWCVMVNPGLIHSNKSMHKISFIFVKMFQALFRDFHASAFLICCEQERHPSCAKLFHIQFFTQNISYTFFWSAYSLSNFTHFHPPVIQYHTLHLFNDSSVVALFGRSSCGSSSRLVRPRLHSAAHFLIVENEGEESL